MARVTVEDCAEVVANRFELVVAAAQRAKDIASGAPITVDRDNDKNVVVALREIAARTISVEKIKDSVIEKYCKYSIIEEDNEGEDTLEMPQQSGPIKSKEIKSLIEEETEFDDEDDVELKVDDSEDDGEGPNFSDDNIDVED